MSKAYATESMALTQNREGQVSEAKGVWIREDPHMTYEEFKERVACMVKRPRLASELAKFRSEYPAYDARLTSARKENRK